MHIQTALWGQEPPAKWWWWAAGWRKLSH